jgi:hypothetical protein
MNAGGPDPKRRRSPDDDSMAYGGGMLSNWTMGSIGEGEKVR